MPSTPYINLGKFDALQTALNQIQTSAVILGIQDPPDEEKKATLKANQARAREALVSGITDLNGELMKILREFDRKIHELG